jgi:two-component system phosphate regulon sensor histidine kinase PhoR
VLALGAVAVAIPVVLALAGRAEAAWALVAAAVAAACATAAWLALGRARDAGEAGPSQDTAGGMSFELLLERLPEPVMLVASGGEPASARIAFANAAARELFPIPPVGGLVVASIRNPAALEVVEAALAGEASEAEIYGGGAQDRAWRVLGRPLPGHDGPAALVLLRDETDVRRVERMRADFLANASHELRTPLASLAGFVETLRGPARDDEAARDKFLAIMSEQAGRMGRLINDLLSLSRIELNEHIAPDGVVDLGAVVRDVLDAAPARGGPRIAPELPPIGEAMVRGDRDQLIQVAQNLIDNAAKYAGPQGVVSVQVAHAETAEAAAAARNPAAARLSLLSPDHAAGERYVVLRVADDGPGIARENLPRLSERFYRVEGQKSGERSGTGLGLAIVKHIMNRHKGGLAVESVVGEGTAFAAYAPAADAEAAS